MQRELKKFLSASEKLAEICVKIYPTNSWNHITKNVSFYNGGSDDIWSVKAHGEFAKSEGTLEYKGYANQFEIGNKILSGEGVKSRTDFLMDAIGGMELRRQEFEDMERKLKLERIDKLRQELTELTESSKLNNKQK